MWYDLRVIKNGCKDKNRFNKYNIFLINKVKMIEIINFK